MPEHGDNSSAYDLAVVAPALNEAGNVGPLVAEITAAFTGTGRRVQVVVVDDGSTDATPQQLNELSRQHGHLKVIRHDTPRGQSASLHDGIAAAAAPLIATLDADLQNDPADLPAMLDLLHEKNVDLVQGDRSANRRDHALRRVASLVGRLARRAIVGDTVRDTGCATRVMRAEFARRLPLHRPGMHRFVPACVAGFGGRIVEVPVNHRPRREGKTKYGTGLLKRGLPGLRDCFAVRAMIRAARRADANPAPASA
ncbi:MAG: glycosyltransferase family 2 protein [Planctomycetota bacterium]